MKQTTQIREFPRPSGWPLVGTIAPFLHGELLRPFVDLFEQFGPLYSIRLPLNHNLVMLAHPDAVEHVLRSRQENYIKGSVYDGARILLGNGLVTSEGALWRHQRALATPAFRPAKLEQYLVTMGECTKQLIAEWQLEAGRGSLDAQDAMKRLTIAIVLPTLPALEARSARRVARGRCRRGRIAAVA